MRPHTRLTACVLALTMAIAPMTSHADWIGDFYSSAGAAVSATAPRPAANGFTIAGERDAVYQRVGQVLESIDGLQIASRAQLLGSYDVAYQGSNFLVRIVSVDAGAYVSAVDPRGLPATGEAATAVMAQLKAGLEG